MNKLNIVFAGTPAFCIPCLNALLDSSHNIQAVYTQPDRPAGRGRKLQASAVKEWALQQQLPVYQPVNFKKPETIAMLRHLKPDIMVVIAYGLILPKEVLEIPKFGSINVHASLLPRFRGASPIQYAILQGDLESGVTIMQMDVGMDTGSILNKVRCPIEPTETAGSLHDKLAQIAIEPLLKTLNELANSTVNPTPQHHELATYTSKINKEDAHINWKNTAIEIDRTIRAFNPWPIAYTFLGKDILRIHKAKIADISISHTPGTVINIDKKGMLVATGNQSILVEKVQFPGSKVISVADWLNSSKSKIHAGFCFNE